jgi:hypothetical protein
MKRLHKIHNGFIFYAFLFIFLSFALPPSLLCGEQRTDSDSLNRFLPLESQLKGWKLDGAPQAAAGQELYLLINGGAEIYIQEGFKQTILASYRKSERKIINLEIFEMQSPEAAKRIQSIKTDQPGIKLSIGEDAVLKDYYLNVKQGAFQITISGYDSEEDTVSMIVEIANLVVNRIDRTH